MNLQFDSLDELKAFLEFAGYAKQDVVISSATGSWPDEIAKLPPRYHEAQTLAEITSPVNEARAKQTAEPPEKMTRKRRTKAEIAADEAAVRDAAAQLVADAPANPTVGDVLAVFGATQADAATTAVPIEELQGVNGETVHVGGAPVESPSSVAPPSDIEHLRLCREFIATHGMNKYDRSFELAGIEKDASGTAKNIMAFTDTDRAKHAAALAHLATA